MLELDRIIKSYERQKMIFEKNKKYNLNDIEKLFSRIPIIFIIFLAVLLLVISYFILEIKANKEIDLLNQKYILEYKLTKKEDLLSFKNEVDFEVNKNFLDLETSLKEITYKGIAYIEANSLKDFSKVKKYLRKLEKNTKTKLMIFAKKDLEILYGKQSLHYIQDLIFSSIVNENNLNITIKYIYSQGKDNLQYWRDDLKRTIRLSFFDNFTINGDEYYLGSFSNISLIKDVTKKSIIKLINKKKIHIWFYDLVLQDVYNFNNKNTFNSSYNLLKDKKNKLNSNYDKSYEILEHYFANYSYNDEFKSQTYLYSKHNFLLSSFYDKSIVDNKIKSSISKIKHIYKKKYIQILIYIFIISATLIFASFLFSNFIKKVFNEYNSKLQIKTSSLEHWKKRFELAIIASNDGLWDINFKNKKIYFSNKWLEMFGYKKDEISDLSSWFNLIHNEDKKQVHKLFDKIFAKDEDTMICEYRLKTKNEGFKWVLARGKAFNDKNNDLDRMLMMSMDIDKSKKMKKELLDIELLVEDGKIVIFKLFNDENLSVKYISNSIQNYGFYKKSFENAELNFMDLIYKDDINIVKVAIKSALNNNLAYFTFVCRALTVDFKIRWVSCRIILIKNHSGEISNFYGYINDITKIKVSEEDLKIKVKKELDKNRHKDKLLIQQSKLAAMGEMIGSIAHQWRQPLNNVSLILQFLRDNYSNKNIEEKLIKKYFSKANIQINYMSDTIDDFKNFYKPSKSIEEFDINIAVHSSLDLIQAQFKHENIKLNINVSSFKIKSYENELKQVFLNILNNAKDAILIKRAKEKFEAYISINVKKEKKELIITFCNNGGNIDKNIINRVFEPYFTTKFETQGTGIGLYMTKNIVETNMQGKIEVDNIKDGVCFNIILPLSLGE